MNATNTNTTIIKLANMHTFKTIKQSDNLKQGKHHNQNNERHDNIQNNTATRIVTPMTTIKTIM